MLPPLARFAMDQYLVQRALPVSPSSPVRWGAYMPLLGDLDAPSAITTSLLREILRWFFHTAADVIEANHPAPARKLRRATPHWIRHTHATDALERTPWQRPKAQACLAAIRSACENRAANPPSSQPRVHADGRQTRGGAEANANPQR
ncbi:hypothetical protein [Paraburkholderia unamae]|uniref:hypothetical protein n=1 Tax=Paraburkholderia unamae TaxID=219649 RepID=UPI002449AAA0|nr:hypothetical protein [Paraburkholderia unamae]